MQKLVRASYWCTVMVIAVFVFHSFLDLKLNGYVRSKYLELIDGIAFKPFVSRLLVPQTVALVCAVTPAGVQAVLNDYAVKSDVLRERMRIYGMEPHACFQYMVGCVLMFGSLVGFLFAFRALLRSLYDAEKPLADIMTMMALVALPAMFLYGSYVYDFPQLLLWTLGLLMLQRGRPGMFLLVYALGVFNKETTVLLSVAYFLLYMPSNGRKIVDRARFVKYGVAQLLIFLASRVIIMARFSENPGNALEFHLVDHNMYLIIRYSLVSVVAGIFLVLLIGYRWREKPLILKYALVAAVPLFVMSLFFGFLDELRGYYEAYPTVLLMMLPAVGSVLGYSVRVREGVAVG